jgi:hypothetical protein
MHDGNAGWRREEWKKYLKAGDELSSTASAHGAQDLGFDL